MNALTGIKSVVKKLNVLDVAFIAIALFILVVFFLVFKRQTVFITIRAVQMNYDSESAGGYVVGDKEKDEITHIFFKDYQNKNNRCD